MNVLSTCFRLCAMSAALTSFALAQTAAKPPDAPNKTQSSAKQARKKARRHSGVAHPPAAMQEQPLFVAPAPLTPAQQSPTAPQVSYHDGMLTVVANNSTLGDILNAVRAKTGASVEYPSGVSQERVMAAVGPAPAPQVLAALLNGSHYDYVLVGADGNPDQLAKAIITAKEGAVPPAGAAPAGTPAAMAAGPTPRSGGAQRPSDDDMENAPPDEVSEQPAEEPPPVQQAPMQQPPPPQQPPQQQGPQQQPQPGQSISGQPQGQFPPNQQQPKSPEQLLQELQRLQQQQQQQQQQPPQEQQQQPQ